MRGFWMFYCCICAFAFSAGAQNSSVENLLEKYEVTQNNEEKYAVLKSVIDFTATTAAEELLVQISETEATANRALRLFIQAEALYYSNKIEDAIQQYDLAILSAENNSASDLILLSTLYAARAYVTEETQGALEAIKYYLKGLNYAKASQLDQEIADLNYSLAKTYATLSDYPNAIHHAEKCFQLDLANNQTASIASDLRLLADFSLKNRNPETADNYAEQALKLIPELKDDLLIASLYRKKAQCSNQLNQPDTSLVYISKALEIEFQLPDNDRITQSLLTKANSFFLKEDWSQALNYCKEAELKALEKNLTRQLTYITALQAKTFLESEEKDLFLKVNHRAIKLAQQQKLLAEEANAYHRLAKFYETNNELKKALENRNLEKKLQDQITKNISAAQLETASVKFDVERIDNEKKQLELNVQLLDEKVKTARRTRLLLGFIILLGLGLLCIFLYNRSRKAKLKQSIQEQQLVIKDQSRMEAELQAIRSQLNPHFMFNSLNSIHEFILRQKTENASDYLVKFSKLMRLVLNNSREKAVLFQKEIEAIEFYIELEALRFENQLQYSIQMDDSLKKDTSVYITPMLVQPFVENAIWHGLRHSKLEKKLNISFHKQNNHLICQVEDNGVGRAESARINRARNHTSRGLALLKDRFQLIEELYAKKASFDIKDRQPSGTVVTIHIPILNPALIQS